MEWPECARGSEQPKESQESAVSLQSSVEKGSFDFLQFLLALGPVFMRLLRLRHQIDLILQTVSSSSPGKKACAALLWRQALLFFPSTFFLFCFKIRLTLVLSFQMYAVDTRTLTCL